MDCSECQHHYSQNGKCIENKNNCLYNGFQAPFLVCIWNKDYAELEDLLKNTSEKLYKAYRKEME